MVYLYVYTLHAGAHYWTDVSFKKKKNNTRSVVGFIFFCEGETVTAVTQL